MNTHTNNYEKFNFGSTGISILLVKIKTKNNTEAVDRSLECMYAIKLIVRKFYKKSFNVCSKKYYFLFVSKFC